MGLYFQVSGQNPYHFPGLDRPNGATKDDWQMNLSTILDQIALGSIAQPEFQRGYVRSRDQVRRSMRSLYLGYPVGSLLTWETQTINADARGDEPLAPGAVKLLLDGQQRVTSLYGIVLGNSPKFFKMIRIAS